MNVRREELGLRSETVRRANLAAIARELHDHGPRSRSDLGAATGLTRSTIRALIGEFVAAGLAFETETVALGTPGRPSALVRPNPERPIALALEIAVDSIAAALVGFGGQVLDQLRVDRPRGELSLQQTVSDLADLTRRLDGWDRARTRAVGVGVAIVGVVRHADGFVSLAPNLVWRDVALGRALRRGLGAFAPISVANEADLGALAEARRGAGRGSANIVFISGEVGVGGGIIVDGRPLAGTAGHGGEVGHLPINPNGRPCRCGSTGCWETEIGEDALLVRAGHAAGGGRDEVEAVLAEARAGSPVAASALEQVGEWLGIGLAGLVNVLNPERVILGGLFGRIHPFVSDVIERQLDRRALSAARALVDVVPAELGVDAPLLGAAELAFEPFLVDPAAWFPAARPLAAVAGA